MHLTVEGASFWVELKSENGRAVALRPQQAAWHARQASCGGRSYVLCGFAHPPYVRIYRGCEAALAGSAGLLCVPALISSDSMADALRLMITDALRPRAEWNPAASRSAPEANEKTPDAEAPGAR